GFQMLHKPPICSQTKATEEIQLRQPRLMGQSLATKESCELRTHPRLEVVRHPERHVAVSAVSTQVVGVVQQTKAGICLDDSRVAERMVKAA
ncbi:hypothetical protein XENOCAPTIV_016578, partial [Xenoophorus captivus]